MGTRPERLIGFIMSKSTMEKLSKQKTQKGHGSPGILLCGLPKEELTTILNFCQTEFATIPVGIAKHDLLDKNLLEIFKNLEASFPETEEKMPPAIIFSGFSPASINRFIDQYRQLKIPSPLWGSRTLSTDFWTLRQLLKNYLFEYQSMQKK